MTAEPRNTGSAIRGRMDFMADKSVSLTAEIITKRSSLRRSKKRSTTAETAVLTRGKKKPRPEANPFLPRAYRLPALSARYEATPSASGVMPALSVVQPAGAT